MLRNFQNINAMRLFLILSLLVILSSCMTQKRCARRFPPKESIRVETIIRDSVVYRDTTLYVQVPGNPVKEEKPVTIRSPAGNIPVTIDTMSIENDYYIAYAWVNNSIMGMAMYPKPSTFELNFKFKENFRLQHTTRDKTETHEIKVVPLFYKVCFYILLLQFILVLLYLVIRTILHRYIRT